MRRSLVLLAMGCAGKIEGTFPFTPDKALVVESGDLTFVMAAAFGPEGSCAGRDVDPDLLREAFTCERFVEPLIFGDAWPVTFGGHSELFATVGPDAQGTLARCGPGEAPYNMEGHVVVGAVELVPGAWNTVEVHVDLSSIPVPVADTAWAKGRFVAERCAP